MTNDLVPQNGANLPAVPQNNNLDFGTLQRVAKMMAVSGFFGDNRANLDVEIAKTCVKILAGQEMGIGPFASNTGIHIVKGKPVPGANLISTLIKNHPLYDYRVVQIDDSACIIDFYERGEKIGTSSFTAGDAKRAGTQNMGKFPRNMLYARAISNGAKWFVPGVFGGAPVYVAEDFGLSVNDDGEIIEPEIIEAEPVGAKPRPAPQPVPQKITVPQTQAAKPNENGGFVVGVAREDLAKVAEPTVGSVVNAMVATGLYRVKTHAINYIKKHIDLPAAYYNGDTLLLDNRVKRDSAQDMLTKAINHELKKKANEEEE